MNGRHDSVPCPRRLAACRQSGAVLTIGLLLLLIVTVLAVSGMQAAAIELQMAGNGQHHRAAFEAAEAGIEQAIAAGSFSIDPTTTGGQYADPAAVEPPPIAGRGTPIAGCPPLDGQPGARCEYFVRFDHATGATPVPNEDPAAGSNLRAYHFVVDCIGVAPRGARSEHTQGFYVVAPAAAITDCAAGSGSCTITPVDPPVRTTWRQRGAD